MKICSIFSFGFVIIPLTYLIGFAFRDYDNAFRNSGIILYTFGFMIADAFISISQATFYKYNGGSTAKFTAMIDPFLFYYWTQGFPVANTFPAPGDSLLGGIQLGLCGAQVVLGLLIFAFVIWLDLRRLGQSQQIDSQESRLRSLRQDKSHTGSNREVSVEAVELKKSYNANKVVVREVSFKLEESHILGILGPNGAGKSTLFSMISMIQPRSHGEILIKDIPVEKFNPVIHNIGIVP